MNIYSEIKEEQDGDIIRKAILRSQRCQRNWDLSKQLSEDQLKTIISAATECPTKQNIPFYSVYVIQDRDIIEAIYEQTTSPSIVEGKQRKNPQVLANTLLVFTEHDFDEDVESINPEINGGKKNRTEFHKEIIHDDLMQAIGIASGYVNLAASLLNLDTGCCKCMDRDAVQKIIGTKEQPLLLMGVGFKQEGVNRRVDHMTGHMIESFSKNIKVELI